MSAARAILRTVTAVYPGPSHPRRGHFIAALHERLAGTFASEVLAPRVYRADPLEEERDGIIVHRFPYPSRERPPRTGGITPWAAARYLVSAARRSREVWPDGDGSRRGAVLAHWVIPAGWIAARVARRLGLPLVLYAHGSDLHRYGRRVVVSRIAGRLIARAARTIVASRELAEIASALSGSPVSAFPIVPVGIDRELTAEAPPPPPPPWRFLFVGDLVRQKGFGLAVQAVAELRRGGHAVELTAVGDGPLRGAGGPEVNVEYTGELAADGVRQAMARAHLLLLPSEGEGTPLVLEEALAMQLPAAATAIGGIPDLYRTRAGWIPLARGGSSADVAARLLSWLGGGASAYKRMRADMASNEVAGLSIDRTADSMARVLGEVLS